LATPTLGLTGTGMLPKVFITNLLEQNPGKPVLGCGHGTK
jgi:hypothetical protein